MPMRADREAVGFSTLDAWAGRIALRLAARGVRRGHRVLVLAEPSAGAVAAVLGVQRIGASHAIADPARPEPSIASAAAGCAAVVTTANGAAARWLADRGLPVVRADECREEPAADRASEPIPAFPDVA